MLINKIIIFGLMVICGVYGSRPFSTDDAGTVAPSGYELEIGYDLWKDEGTIGLGFKHGLTEKMDIGIGFGFNLVSEPKNSFLPAELCLKYALVPDLFAVSFATEFGTNSYNLNGIITRCFGPIEINANLGYGTADSSITYAGATLFSTQNFIIGGEIFGDKKTQNWLLGGCYIIKECLMVVAGFSADFKFKDKLTTIGLYYEF